RGLGLDTKVFDRAPPYRSFKISRPITNPLTTFRRLMENSLGTRSRSLERGVKMRTNPFPHKGEAKIDANTSHYKKIQETKVQTDSSTLTGETSLN
ncbi:hypothetical protein L9F63_011487, partial [Diploptera punctata]